MRFFKSKGLVIAIALINLLMLAGIFRMFFENYMPDNLYRTGNVFLEGEYSIDNGEWKKIKPDMSIRENFHKIRIRGVIPFPYNKAMQLALYSKNIWYSLKTADGKTVIEHKYVSIDEYIEEYHNESDAMDAASARQYKEFLERVKPYELDMPDTPGYMMLFMEQSGEYAKSVMKITPDTQYIFEAENPYKMFSMPFSECMVFSTSNINGEYLILLKEYMPKIMLFFLECCMGVFFFPAAGISMGRKNYKYLSFGMVCFLWGIHMMIRTVSFILNRWLPDPTLCMFIDKMAEYSFVIALLIYFRTYMKKDLTRAISGITLIGFACFAVIAAALHILVIADLMALTPIYSILEVLIACVTVVLLAVEISDRSDKLMFLLFWCPMAGVMLIEATSRLVGRTEPYYLMFGLSVTIVVNIIQMTLDIRHGYNDRLRYERVKRELYESRVAVMSSQIRPHFIYNALTSIAMLCTLDPPTAQTAVITFAKYLRENMDAMNQKERVPFTREYEHLKKYLYIEKLRFGDKLNIEYDIRTENFFLPLLSIQPLVENAVKHGVGQKKGGGTVFISTRETEDAFIIVVRDDGVGFVPGQKKVNDNRSHMGIENTRMRIKEMCRGDVIIESGVGEGTTITIVLPKEGQINENSMS